MLPEKKPVRPEKERTPVEGYLFRFDFAEFRNVFSGVELSVNRIIACRIIADGLVSVNARYACERI